MRHKLLVLHFTFGYNIIKLINYAHLRKDKITETPKLDDSR